LTQYLAPPFCSSSTPPPPRPTPFPYTTLFRSEPDDDDRRGRGENQSLAELRSAGRALIDVSRRLHSAIIVRALLLTASREDRREDERTVRLLRGEFSAVGAELTFQSAQAR